MKAKTILELATLSASLYTISKNTQIIEKMRQLAEEGKDKVNAFMKEHQVDEDGNDIEFVDKMLQKATELREDLEQKISQVVAELYEKLNIAHTDQIGQLEEKIASLSKDLALAESRIHHLESKQV
jgi:polyhydroxyalkanoate synthesis regulator phasin